MDKQEFARRVTQMQGSLYRVAASYLRGESDRLDAVAEAIARAWEKRGTLRDEALFSTWMTRILIRVCVDIQRRQKRMTPVDTLPETPTGEDSCAALREAVDSLPQKLRTMIVLYYMEGYEVLEVARIMGTTTGAVCAGLSRAREKLRAMLGEEERGKKNNGRQFIRLIMKKCSNGAFARHFRDFKRMHPRGVFPAGE